MSDALVNDYIGLTWSQFADRHDSKDLDSFVDNIDETEFKEKHLYHGHVEGLTKVENKESMLQQIRDSLKDKEFSDEYIVSYIQALDKVRPDDLIVRNLKEEVLPYFRYNNSTIETTDLKAELDAQNLTTTSVDKETRKGLMEQIKLYISQNTIYNKGLQSLLIELESETTSRSSTKINRRISSITHIDPNNRKHRGEVYDFYEERFSLYLDLKNKIKEVLTLWDKVEENITEEMDKQGKETGRQISQYKSLDSESTIEELDAELEKLQTVYNKMDDDLNYIIKLPLISFDVNPNRDRSVSENVRGLMLEKLSILLDKEYVERIEDDYVDEEFEYDEPVYEQYSEEGEDKDTQPQADIRPEDKTEEQVDMERVLQEAEPITALIDVDPLFVIASEQGILKKKYSVASWTSTKKEIQGRLKDAELNNPGVAPIYKLILDEHEEYKEQAYDEDDGRDSFYIPITGQVLAKLSKYTDIKVDITKLEELHEDLVKVILYLLEEPLDASTYPIHLELEDMAPGKESMGDRRLPGTNQQRARDAMLDKFNLFSRVKVGNKGKRREAKAFGKFADTLMELFEIADKYYGDPIRELMIPYKTVPKYLDADTLSPLINHGPENIGQLALGLYRDYFIAFVTPRDLTRLTDYLVTSNSARKSVDDLEKKSNAVLDVLSNIVPSNQENDIRWFANELKEQAKRDSSFNIEGVRLKNRRIEELDYKRSKHKTSYHNVIWLIYKFKDQFLKNPYTKETMEDFIVAYKNQSDMKYASYIQTNVLEAHDEIRKMLGKPIYYNTCQTDNFDNVSDTIDIIKEDYNIELISTDIIGIVNEFDTMKTLAKKYGTKEDVIYHVKALYR